MSGEDYRVEHDTLGEVRVPAKAVPTQTVAMCMAVGNVSFVDWLMLT